MEQQLKTNLIISIGRIYEEAKNCNLEDDFYKTIETDLSLLADFLHVSKTQALIIATIFVFNYKGDSVSTNDLIHYYNCNPVKLLLISDDFNFLINKKIISKKRNTHKIAPIFTNDEYYLNQNIFSSIFNYKEINSTESKKIVDLIDLLEQIHSICLRRVEEEISTDLVFEEIGSLLKLNKHFPLIQRISHLNLKDLDLCLFFYLMWNTIQGKKTIDVDKSTQLIFDNSSDKVKYVQALISGQNQLIKGKYIELGEATFFNDLDLQLANRSIQLLEEFGIKIYLNKDNTENIIHPSDIRLKKLFFNDEEKKQNKLLKSLLKDSKLKEIQSRMKFKGYPTGICTLFHGGPGTGKTELVYQLAKETNREIIRVDISQRKSMWFGESEKMIKAIFTEYKTHLSENKQMPILLLNEADGLIMKRKEFIQTSSAQTENSIQNILLEELENFEGILFATTNLVGNLDHAFERRFLFKVQFNKPSQYIKSKIWKEKLPFLTSNQSNFLASSFDFSGGQIENVARKNEIEEIVYGKSISFQEVIENCENERLEKKSITKIGF